APGANCSNPSARPETQRSPAGGPPAGKQPVAPHTATPATSSACRTRLPPAIALGIARRKGKRQWFKIISNCAQPQPSLSTTAPSRERSDPDTVVRRVEQIVHHEGDVQSGRQRIPGETGRFGRRLQYDLGDVLREHRRGAGVEIDQR